MVYFTPVKSSLMVLGVPSIFFIRTLKCINLQVTKNTWDSVKSLLMKTGRKSKKSPGFRGVSIL